MTENQAKAIGRVLGKGRYRVIQYRPDGYEVVIPANEHDSALTGCTVISDKSIRTLFGIHVNQYEPFALYEGHECVVLNFDDPSDMDDDEDE